jgi:hypothetical protein
MRCRLGLNRRRILQSLNSLISTDNEVLTYHQSSDILGLTDSYPYTLADSELARLVAKDWPVCRIGLRRNR